MTAVWIRGGLGLGRGALLGRGVEGRLHYGSRAGSSRGGGSVIVSPISAGSKASAATALPHTEQKFASAGSGCRSGCT